ncbi:MAG TPA: transposase [Polyangiaceae bacterium]|jgi:transposase|nr:transposase [Polyangiaceae bacterium]
MSMGRREDRQTPMWLSGPELARSPGHRFYEKLNELLKEADFDRRVEQICAPYFEADNKPGRPSIAPGVYFRMLFVGYFEGIESERGLEWRCADSLSLRTFLGVQVNERVPDHSSLSRTRTRLDGAVYDQVFRLVLGIVESKGLLRGKVAGVDSTYLRADASMKTIVRKDTGDDYTTYLKKLCEAQGVENPTDEDARRMDRKRTGKKTSNKDWESPTDADARIVRLKDGRTRLGYKAEHVVDLETGAIVAAEMYRADEADTATLRPSLEAAREHVAAARAELGSEGSRDDDDDELPPAAPSGETRPTIEVVADKGYHKVELLFELRRAEYRTYIPVPDQKGQRSFTDKGGMLAREAFHDNRSRVRRTKGKKLLRLRGERIERTFALACETGAHRRVRLRGRDNARKRYVAHVAALNLGLVMRTLFGHGTPRQAAAAVLLALIVALRIAYERIAGFGERIVGTLLPHPGPRHRVDGLAA